MEKDHKARIGVAILWIILFLIGAAITVTISHLLGMPDLGTPVYGLLFALVLFIYMQKKKAFSYYGIRSLKALDGKTLLYCIPFGLVVIINWIFGFVPSFSWWQIVFAFDALIVGFNEEILFRGFLFKALQKKGNVFAIVISSCVFALLHITALFGGKDILFTLIRCFACGIFGFAVAVFFYRTGNIIPCIIFHGIYNMGSVFTTNDINVIYMKFGLESIILLAYAIYLLRMNKCAAKQTVEQIP